MKLKNDILDMINNFVGSSLYENHIQGIVSNELKCNIDYISGSNDYKSLVDSDVRNSIIQYISTDIEYILKKALDTRIGMIPVIINCATKSYM